MAETVLLFEQDPGRLTPDLEQRDPALVEPEPHREPGALVEPDGLREVPDGQEEVVETEQFVRLVI